MSEQTDSTVVVVELKEEKQSFLTGSLDLKRLLREVSRQSKPAVDALVLLLASKDEKIRLTAAIKLLELQVSVAKEINTDQIQRLIAELKYNPTGKKNLVAVDDDDSDKPLVDFHNIQKIE